MPSVAGIICNFNRREDVLRCIASAKELDYPDLELFVVDNASTDGSADAIAATYPDVRLLRCDVNNGSCGGFNEGMRAALAEKRHRYLFLMDNDILLDRKALTHLVDELERQPAIAAVGSKIYCMDRPDVVQEFGGFIHWAGPRVEGNLRLRKDRAAFKEVEDVAYLASCAMLVRSDVAKSVGLMDEGYFLYFDDVDWSRRMVGAGYGLRAVAASKVRHVQGSQSRSSSRALYYGVRNSIHFFNRYLPQALWQKSIGRLLEYYFHVSLTCELFGKTETQKAVDGGIGDVLAGRRGKAELSFGVNGSPKLWPYHALAERRIHIYPGRFRRNIKILLEHKLPEASVRFTEPGDDVSGDVVLLPCAHVFNRNTASRVADAEVYWADVNSNLLPPDSEGAELQAAYDRRMREFIRDVLVEWRRALATQRTTA